MGRCNRSGAAPEQTRGVAGVDFEALAKHAVMLEIEGERVPVLDLDGLLLTKQSDRPKDRADAELLRQALARRKP